MKQIKQIMIVVLALVLAASLSLTAFAATASQDGLELSVTTDKTSYSATEQVTVTVTVKNTNTFAVSNVAVESNVPDGYKPANGYSSTKNIATLGAGETATLTVAYVPQNSGQPSGPSYPTYPPYPWYSGNTSNTSDAEETEEVVEIDQPTEGNTNVFEEVTVTAKRNVGLWVLIAVVSAGALIAVLAGKKRFKKTMSIMLCVAMVGTLAAVLPVEVNATVMPIEEGGVKTVSANTEISVNGKTVNIYATARWSEGYDESIHTVSFDLVFDRAVEDTSPYADQYVSDGALVKQPADPKPFIGYFDGWYTSPNFSTKFDFNTPIVQDTVIFAKLDIDDTDSDQDGLFDETEIYIGTDPLNPDTDGDGLNDYIELTIETDPKKIDTDDNGISDYDEDYDEDGLSNGIESEHGTYLDLSDSDYDGLTDYDEIQVYLTNALLKDSDGDGADDKWEIDNGYNPLEYDYSFAITVAADIPTDSDPVTAGVTVTLNGGEVSSLEVTKAGIETDPLLTPFIAGYLGSAYSFNADGQFDTAQITFCYDTSLGMLSDTFQPRIYYFNEANGTFEELPNQIVENGYVTATVSHFSTYILLNKVDFDAVWETEIKPPITSGDPSQNATLDIAFVLDHSSSMKQNDPNRYCKELAKEFISKLRDGIDRASVTKFSTYATLLSELTYDKELLYQTIDEISYNGSWTNGSDGLKTGLDSLQTSMSNYKYVIFITDGEDNEYSYSYNDLISQANSMGVKIYSIGMGTARESVLRQLADETGGKYYHATTGTATEDIIDLEEVFKDISSETVDLTVDSNNDGIPDYYNDLIFNGELPLSNASATYVGIDFNYDKDGNISDDYDGDGLKNGQELIITQDGDYVYIKLYSDPLMVHSDSDGVDDYNEWRNRSDPLRNDYESTSISSITNTDMLYYKQLVDLYDNDWLFRMNQGFFGGALNPVGGGLTDRFDKIAEEQIINYFYDYCTEEATYEAIITMAEATNGAIGNIQKYIKYIKTADKVVTGLTDLEILEEVRKAGNLIAQYSSLKSDIYYYYSYSPDFMEQRVIELVTELYESEALKVYNQIQELKFPYKALGEVYLKVKDLSDKYKTFMDTKVISDLTWKDTIKLIGVGADLAKETTTLAKANAISSQFEKNMDILLSIRDNAKYLGVSIAAQEVLNAIGKGTTSYYTELASALFVVGEEALIGEIIDTLLKENPLAKGYKTAMSILKLLGGKELVTSIYSILCYSDMIDSANKLCTDSFEKISYGMNRNYYVTKESDSSTALRYLTHVAQLSMLAEKVYIDMKNTDAFHDGEAQKNIDRLKTDLERMKIKLPAKLMADLGFNNAFEGGGRGSFGEGGGGGIR